MKQRHNQSVAGVEVGVLTLDTRHVLVPGNVQHARSFEFPVRYEVVKGVAGAALMAGEPGAARAIITGARNLEAMGVSVIVGACGSFANYQAQVAAEVAIPVFMSILLEVPLLLRGLPPSRKLGIIFASTATFTDEVRDQCDIRESSRIVAIGADRIDAFGANLRQSSELDSRALETGLVQLCEATLDKEPSLGAWLLQCSDLPPYASAIHKATQLPVFDMVSFINHVHSACGPRAFA